MFKRKKPAVAATSVGAPVDPLAALGDPSAIANDFPLYNVKDIKAMQKQFVAWLGQANSTNKDTYQATEVPSHVVVNQPNAALNGLFALAIYTGPGHTVGFREYLAVLTLFHPKTPLMDKQKGMFRLHDVDRDGVVSPADAHHVLTRYLDFVVDESTVASSMRDFIKTSDVGLTPQEFNQMVTDNEVLAAMTIL